LKEISMTVTRRLGDLYKLGAKVDFEDQEGPVSVWVSKLSPLQKGKIERRAGAAKARYMHLADDVESDEYLSTYAAIRDLDVEQILPLLIAEDFERAKLRIEAQVSAEDQWAEENYLQSLRDAWLGDDENRALMHVYGEEPDDPEAKRVFTEMQRYLDQVRDELTAERDSLLAAWADVPEEEAWTKGTEHMLKRQMLEAYASEYNLQAVFEAVHELEIKEVDGEEEFSGGKRYFAHVDEVRELDETVFVQLAVAVSLMEVGDVEGKGLLARPASSDSSDPSETPETSEVSGPVESLT
jgi:hypothetical protein